MQLSIERKAGCTSRTVVGTALTDRIYVVGWAVVDDAIRHHNWATMRVLDACADLTDEQLHQPFPTMYGCVQETLRHVVDSDGWYLFRLADTEGDYDDADLGAIRVAAEANGREWERQLAEGWDPDLALTTPTIDGPVEHTFVGIWLAQAMHHLAGFVAEHLSVVATPLQHSATQPARILDFCAFLRLLLHS